MCELIGALILSQLSNIINNTYIRLYRDDGLIIIGNPNEPKLDSYRKRISNPLKLLGFKITIHTNLKIVNFLDVALNLCKGTYIFTNPSARAGYDTRSIFKRSFPGFNSEFSFSYTSCLTKAEELSLSYYLPIAGGRIIEFIPFPRVSVLCEMQSFSSWIWTCVAVSISYDDNHYTAGTLMNSC